MDINRMRKYDFNYPEKLTKPQFDSITAIFQTFSTLASSILSKRAKAPMSMEMSSIDQCKFKDFLQSTPPFATQSINSMEPLSGKAIIEMDAGLTYSFIEMLQGGNSGTATMNRELTDIELSLMEGVFVYFLGSLREAWKSVLDIRPRLCNLETNPRYSQIVLPEEMVLQVTIGTTLGTVSGVSRVCIPLITLEPVLNKIHFSPAFLSMGKGYNNFIETRIGATTFKRFATFNGVLKNMTAREILKIKRGMKLPLQTAGSYFKSSFIFHEQSHYNDKNRRNILQELKSSENRRDKNAKKELYSRDGSSKRNNYIFDLSTFSYMISLRFEDSIVLASEVLKKEDNIPSLVDYVDTSGVIMIGDRELARGQFRISQGLATFNVEEVLLPDIKNIKKQDIHSIYFDSYPSTLSLELCRKQMPLKDAVTVSSGSIIEFDTPVDTSFSVIHEEYGTELAKASVVVMDDVLGMHIESTCYDSKVTVQNHFSTEPTVTIRCIMGKTILSLPELLTMGIGSAYELDRIVGSSADIIVGEDTFFKGEVIVINNKFCVRIVKEIEEVIEDSNSEISSEAKIVSEIENDSTEVNTDGKVNEVSPTEKPIGFSTDGIDDTIAQLSTNELKIQIQTRLDENSHLVTATINKMCQDDAGLVASVLVVMGLDVSSTIMKLVDQTIMETLTYEIARINWISSLEADYALQQFLTCYDKLAVSYEAGIDYIRDVLENAFGTDHAVNIINRMTAALTVRPFDFIRQVDPEILLQVIKDEHPQTIALVLSFLKPEHAAWILSGLDVKMQCEVSSRIAFMNRVTPDVLREVERVLERKLSVLASEESISSGGIESIVDVLSNVDPSTESDILCALDNDEPELAGAIKSRMFVFDDIMILDDYSLQVLLNAVPRENLCKAVKGVAEDLRIKILDSMSSAEQNTFKKELESLGSLFVAEVEASQHSIINTLRRLIDEGNIIINQAP